MDPFVSKASGAPYHHRWTDLNQDEPPQTALDSPLLALGRCSDVDPLLPEQVADARRVLRLRRALVDEGRDGLRDAVLDGQRRVVERFLAGRRGRFGDGQCQPLADVPALVREGRDVFLVIKFMDEAPHLAATLLSLMNQDIDPGRVVILAVDNNSTDGSDVIAKDVIANNPTAVRMLYLNQATPGAGNAARLGVDTCIATVYEMCRVDGRWDRLQTASVAVSDGDTVYHPATLRTVARMLDEQPTVDGVMPFLTYKFTAALRLLRDYRPALPGTLARCAELTRCAGDRGAGDRGAGDGSPTPVGVDLSTVDAFDLLPRWGRRAYPGGMRLAVSGGEPVDVPLPYTDEDGRWFGVIVDPRGRTGYVFADRTVVLAQAPVAGFDAALVFLENGGVRRDEKWRWHAVIGHDLFLYWAFRGMGLPERMVYPDTSDALKTFRVWSFAIGGQHQLRRPGLRIATGSDYQSGRVLQAVGATSRLGPAEVFAETETDRLIKMVRNFMRRQSVFYGETRGAALERATGLYVHMTRIQGDIERELRDYPDEAFEHTVFPERVLFPLRWILQNAVRFCAHGERERRVVRDRVLATMFTPAARTHIERDILTGPALRALADAPYRDKQLLAERLAEAVIAAHYPDIMAFYQATLRDFCAAHRVAPQCYEWLLDGLTASRNAVVERPPRVDPAAVWEGAEFDIDVERGQVLRMRGRG
ncbi:MAG: hypothetical protein AUI14_03980 [Actinobacteria bacterium 13_2_20CM_2_71_6]|nr:MAG: hypothetical protein AUI14_03980 [Actinobacteria bacterium 13_2_20CM_2_71_6]